MVVFISFVLFCCVFVLSDLVWVSYAWVYADDCECAVIVVFIGMLGFWWANVG